MENVVPLKHPKDLKLQIYYRKKKKEIKLKLKLKHFQAATAGPLVRTTPTFDLQLSFEVECEKKHRGALSDKHTLTDLKINKFDNEKDEW